MQRKNDELKEQMSQIKQKMNTIAMLPVLQGAQGDHKSEDKIKALREADKIMAEFELNK